MTSDDRAILNEFLENVQSMNVNKSPAGKAKKKPLLLLLVLADLQHGRFRENKIHFADVQERLTALILEYGGRPAQHGAKPEQPFFHLRTSPFWELTIPNEMPDSNKKTLARRVLAAPGVFAALRPSIFELLKRSCAAREEAINVILQRWWNPDDAAGLRVALGL